MTTASDEVALLAAIAANPDDVSAKLAHADLVGESGPLRGCMLRILAQPDCDDWRLQYAQAIEPVDSARAEFIRVQCHIHRRVTAVKHCTSEDQRLTPLVNVCDGEPGECLCTYPVESGGARDAWCPYHNAVHREAALRAAHEADWRKAGPCPKCYRKVNPVTREQTPMGCNSCNGTGDVGMLCGRSDDQCPKCRNTLQNATPSGSPNHRRCASCKTVFERTYRHPVQWRRGFIEQIDARLDEVFERCRWCAATGVSNFTDVGSPIDTCPECDGRTWRPTARALAWVREFPTCQRVRLVDRVPFGADFPRLGNRHLFYPADDGDQLTDHCIPRLVYDVQGERIRLGFVPEAISYATAEAAHDALARGVVAVLRAHKD